MWLINSLSLPIAALRKRQEQEDRGMEPEDGVEVEVAERVRLHPLPDLDRRWSRVDLLLCRV